MHNSSRIADHEMWCARVAADFQHPLWSQHADDGDRGVYAKCIRHIWCAMTSSDEMT